MKNLFFYALLIWLLATSQKSYTAFPIYATNKTAAFSNRVNSGDISLNENLGKPVILSVKQKIHILQTNNSDNHPGRPFYLIALACDVLALIVYTSHISIFAFLFLLVASLGFGSIGMSKEGTPTGQIIKYMATILGVLALGILFYSFLLPGSFF